MPDHHLIEFLSDYFGILFGAIIGIGLTVLARHIKEKCDKSTRRRKLLINIKREIDGYFESIKNPTIFNPEYKPYDYSDTSKIITGTQVNMIFPTYDRVNDSKNFGLLDDNLVSSISGVMIRISTYAKGVDQINSFNIENDFVDVQRRKNIAKYLVENMTNRTNEILEDLEKVKKELKKIDSP